MRSTLLKILPGILCVLAAVLSVPLHGRAQALDTASRSMDIAAFGGYSAEETDYARSKDQGAAFGVDITRFFHLPVVPSLEARANVEHGTIIDETTYLGGLRIEKPLHRLHPYVDFLIGAGTLHFKFAPTPGYTGDRSKVYSYGGGIDIDLVHNFALKIDAQYQNWNLGPNAFVTPPGANFTLTPAVGILGVEYHIPFRARTRQRDFYR
jgi:opacity protein-like surface antigen